MARDNSVLQHVTLQEFRRGKAQFHARPVPNIPYLERLGRQMMTMMMTMMIMMIMMIMMKAFKDTNSEFELDSNGRKVPFLC
jgi:hypothetical protein